MTMTSLPRAAEIKRLFRKQGLAPKKWMGQNLLVDESYLARIVRASNVVPGEWVVEIGAGLGVLTQALLERGARVCAVEFDAGFFRVLQETFENNKDVTLIHADALKFDFGTLADRLGKLKVVANLPYNISSRLIFMFVEKRQIFSTLTIMLQKEVAERITASPNSRDYGILTVLLGVNATVDTHFDIPSRAFFPVPKVSSTLLTITFPDPPPIPVSDPALLALLVKTSFAARRKTLRNALKGFRIPGLSREQLADAAAASGIDLGLRAENLEPGRFARFADELASRVT